MNRIYLDYAATTPLDPEVREAMLPFLNESWGNASAIYQEGQTARRAIDRARDRVAMQVGCESSEVYFTSGGTEADNTALLGVLLAGRGRDHLVTTAIEHHAVLDTATFARDTLGFAVTIVAPDRYGFIHPSDVADAITDRTALVSVMHANNEVGTIQPIRAIADAAHERGAYFHTDAVQTLGQLPVSLADLGADLMTLSAHKIYGPKGAGALIVRIGVPWVAWQHGGQQEREKRAGTENVAAIVGFGRAVELLPGWRDTEAVRLALLRDTFVREIQAHLPPVLLLGHPTDRLPNNANLLFPHADGEALLLSLDMAGVSVSSGSACASGSVDPSHVLLTMGLPPDVAKRTIRFSLGRQTDTETISHAIPRIIECANRAGESL